jgi:hypothetical protein
MAEDCSKVVKTEPEGRCSSCAASLDALLYVRSGLWGCSGMEVAEPHGAAPNAHGCWSDHVPHRLLDTWRCLNPQPHGFTRPAAALHASGEGIAAGMVIPATRMAKLPLPPTAAINASSASSIKGPTST